MGLDFYVIKPDGTKDKWIFMSPGSFSRIIRIGKKAGIDVSEYRQLVEYSGLGDYIIPLENVKKILVFYRKMLSIIEDLETQGIILLDEQFEQSYQSAKERGSTLSRAYYETTKPTLRQLIEFFERAVEVQGSIAISA